MSAQNQLHDKSTLNLGLEPVESTNTTQQTYQQEDMSKEHNFFQEKSKVKKRGVGVPGFVSTFSKVSFLKQDGAKDKTELNSLAISKLTKQEKTKRENLNSFSSIFKQDHDEIKGIKRVFRKSMILLGLKILLFAMMSIMSINLFATNLLLLVGVIALYIVVSNIFYIILADKSYVFIGLLLELVILFGTHLTIGKAFTPVTIALTVIIILFSYYAYSELEKVQLGSRLFTIGQIAGESTSALVTMIALLLSLGIYNSMTYNGLEKIVKIAILDNTAVFNKFVIGDSQGAMSLNRIYDISNKSSSNTKVFTFGDFLAKHYKNGREVVMDSELSTLRDTCKEKKTIENCDDVEFPNIVKAERLNEWKAIAYPTIKYSLDEPLDNIKFREVTKQFYLNLACSIEKGDDCVRNKELSSNKDSEADIKGTKEKIADVLTKDNTVTRNLPRFIGANRADFVPVLFAVLLFIFISLLKPILGFILFIFTWITWQILKLFGFVKIEVETVEAEVVSI